MSDVAILMATYNGEKFLMEQIESIKNQSYGNWHLFIRDDFSKDNTSKILDNFKRDPKITILDSSLNINEKGQLGNFEILMNNVPDQYEYVMFSDQDDVWYTNKIEISLNEIRHLPNEKVLPKLVYTNYDEFFEVVGDGSVNYSGVEKKNKPTYQRIFLHNWLMGNTMIINRNLLEISKNIPIEAVNHDAWLALVAGLYDGIGYIDSATDGHRMHSFNITRGADAHKKSTIIKSKLIDLKKYKVKFDRFSKLVNELELQFSNSPIKIKKRITMLKYFVEKKGIEAIIFGKKNGFFTNIHGHNTLLYLEEILRLFKK